MSVTAKTAQEVVITGGPGCGQTAALNTLQQRLEAAGYGVVVVPESQSRLLDAIRDEDHFITTASTATGRLNLERLMLKQALADREAALDTAALLPQERVVILYEGGVIDAAARLDRADFGDLLHAQSLSFDAARDNYALVAHLTTAAASPDATYVAGGRHPGRDEAIRQDREVRSAWAGHRRQLVIPATADFNSKLDQLSQAVMDGLHTPLIDDSVVKPAAVPTKAATHSGPRQYVGVFLGSRYGTLPEYEQAARELGEELVARGYGIVYGGASVGLMGTLAKAAIAAGGDVIGVIPQDLLDREGKLPGLTDLRTVTSIEDRKSIMGELSVAFVVLPGGHGTLDELFQMSTRTQLRADDKPTVVYDIADFYQHLLAHLEHTAERGFMNPEHRGLVVRATSASEVVDRVEAGLQAVAARRVAAAERSLS